MDALWPQTIIDEIDSWNLSDEDRLGLVATIDEKLQRAARLTGSPLNLQISFGHGDYQAYLHFEAHEDKLAITDGFLYRIGPMQ